MKTCVELEARETGSFQNYVNGNIFDGITCDDAINGVVTKTTGTAAVNGNQFTNFQFQTRDFPNTDERAISLSSGSAHNLFQMEIWDWKRAKASDGTSEQLAIEKTNNGGDGNIFIVNGVAPDEIDVADDDVFFGSKATDTPRYFSSSDLPNASDLAGRIAYVDDTDKGNIAWSNGKVWRSSGGVIENNYQDHTTTKELDRDEIGAGVVWETSGATNTVAFKLMDSAKVGDEVIFTDPSSPPTGLVIVIPVGDEFYEPITNTSADAAKLLAVVGGYVHLKSYTDGIWTIEQVRGRPGATPPDPTWNFVTP